MPSREEENYKLTDAFMAFPYGRRPKGSASALCGILAFPLRASDLKVVCRQDDNRRGFCFVDNSYIIAKKNVLVLRKFRGKL